MALLFLFTTMLAGGSIYSVVDLGSLGGSSAIAYGINDSGSVVGWAETAGGTQNAFLSANGAFQNLALPSSSDSYAYGINASGTVAGNSVIDGQTQGTIWSGGTATNLGAGVFATGINDAGVVIGSNGHAFELVNGTFRDLGLLPGGDWSAAYGINDAGTVVGYGNVDSVTYRGFVWTATGGMMELGTLGGSDSEAMAVNDSGEVVGQASLADGSVHAFSAIGAMMTDLGSLGGSSYAYDINDSGEIVGYSWLSGSGGDTHAFLYENGAMVDLNSLIDTAGWELIAAYGINNAGQIVGEGLYQGQEQAFLLDPIASVSSPGGVGQVSTPDPGTGTLAVIGVGLLFLSRVRIRRR